MFIIERKSIFLILSGLFLIPLIVCGQISTTELKKNAEEKFESGNYSGAYELYTSLLERYPKDGKFNYYAGICLYKTDKDPVAAIEHLDYASSKPQVPVEVFYYLGQVYKKNYQFSEAKTAFQKYLESAGRNKIKELQPDLEVVNSGNAKELTLEYNTFEILASSLFTFADTNYIRQVRGKGGVLSLKPEEFLTRNEKEGELSTYMFLPKNPQKGDHFYTSGYSRPRKKDTDIFRVRKNGRRSLGEREELSVINSEYDEILPYYDPVGNDLYFSSKGHNSMGGFDVFKSHYDTERKEWSEPVNLGFPINSPDNDYLAMPGPDLGTFLLITDRQGLDSMLTVYKLILQEPKKSLAGADHEELKRIGNLGGISAIPEITDIKKETSGREERDEQYIAGISRKNEVPAERLKNANEINIATALSYQKKSDSLSMLARETRSNVMSIQNADERWEIQRQVIEWEKKAREYSKKADTAFALNDSNRDPESVPKTIIPETIEKEKEINGITVYKFKNKKEGIERKTEATRGKHSEENKEVVNEKLKAFETEDEPGEVIRSQEKASDMNRFLIQSKSPYNADNPFPEDVDIPDGAFYRIQLGVFSKDVSYDSFGGISPVNAETIPGKSLTRFYAGKFSNYNQARDALNRIKEKGFSDAFIVSWYNGEKVSLNKVIELEKRDNAN